MFRAAAAGPADGETRRSRSAATALLCLLSISGLTSGGRCANWPQWRCDAARSAATPDALPERLHLRWVRKYPPPKPAWPEWHRLHFDTHYSPTVVGKHLIFGSSRNDRVSALTRRPARKLRDLRHAREVLSFGTEGAKRLLSSQSRVPKTVRMDGYRDVR
jgi:hypothetical protein